MSETILKVLNVGGNSKAIPIPECFDGWQHDLLDIDPRGTPDLVCDARELWRLTMRVYDAVYCSHNLEHFYRHEVPDVLKGFRLVLKKNGFAYIRVPDLLSVMKRVTEDGLDLDDVLYKAPAGPIQICDAIYGFQANVERTGKEYFAHKTGFTEKILTKTLKNCGFPFVFTKVVELDYEIIALAFLQQPTDFQIKLFGIPS